MFCRYYFNQYLKKAKKISKWPNHFISGKLFQKRPNGNPETRKTRKEAREGECKDHWRLG